VTTTDWKSKTTEYSRDKKQLKKRIKELTKSRDEWKEKSIRHKERADKLATDLTQLAPPSHIIIPCSAL
jgi:F0F1-type ATP synthase assembly protein I